MITGSLFLMYGLGLLLGGAAGFVMHRSDYCMAGMFRDAFLFNNVFRLRALFLQVVVTMAIFEVARLSGFLPLYPFPLLGFPSLANIIGGVIFGIGMVMAGGCVVGTLYKMGAGSVISLTAFAGLLIGSGLYAEFHPFWAVVIKHTTFSHGSKTIPQLLGIAPVSLVLIVVGLSSFLFLQWQAAFYLSAIGLFSYLFVGMPLGITTTYAKMAAMLENLIASSHVNNLDFFQLSALNVVHPATGALMQGGPGPRIDMIWAVQFPVIVGIVLGSTLSALILKEFAIHYKVPFKQLLMSLTGGILLGVSSRMVPGCNVWHLMGGLPIMALQSVLFLLGIIPGSWLGGKIVSRVILR
jgi:hypothetical protein